MVSEAKKRANIEYNRRQDNIMIRPSKEHGKRIRDAAAADGLSVQAFIIRAVDAWMDRDQDTQAE